MPIIDLLRKIHPSQIRIDVYDSHRLCKCFVRSLPEKGQGIKGQFTSNSYLCETKLSYLIIPVVVNSQSAKAGDVIGSDVPDLVRTYTVNAHLHGSAFVCSCSCMHVDTYSKPLYRNIPVVDYCVRKRKKEKKSWISQMH